MAVIFDGRAFASAKQNSLKQEVMKLNKRGVKPKLVSILVGDDPASILYVNLKKKAAEIVGCKLLVVNCEQSVEKEELINKIEKYNKDKSIHGIMVQLPLPKNFSIKDRNKIINSIVGKKDVDGLKDDSPYLTPTVKAVLEVIREATPYIMPFDSLRSLSVNSPLEDQPLKVVVVGARGFEGEKIFKVLQEMGYNVEGLDRKTKDLGLKTENADILISVTGSPGIIGKDEVKEGTVVIDVGSPKGDVRTEEIVDKAAFISPVPGGVGPVTISALLENLLEAAKSTIPKLTY